MLTLALIVFGVRIRLFRALVGVPSRPLPIALGHDFFSFAVTHRVAARQSCDVLLKHRVG
jgi:hypothetical protein